MNTSNTLEQGYLAPSWPEEYGGAGLCEWTENLNVTPDAADGMFCLVRTDREAPQHEGISLLLIDMSTPGIPSRRFV